MIRLLLSAPASGSGKTVMTCALLSALRHRGLAPVGFKCGPDYLDPMLYAAACGIPGRTLDAFFMEPNCLRLWFARGCQNHGAAVCEGAMGYYDGLGGVSDACSTYAIARTLDLPVVLVLSVRGAALTLAAQIRGLASFRRDSHVAAVLLSGGTPELQRTLAPVLEREGGIPVLGGLPTLSQGELPSRHLGLASDVPHLSERFHALGTALEHHADLDRLAALCEGPPPDPPRLPQKPPAVRIAVAQDAAFSFLYPETVDALRDAGGEIVWFSPLRDASLPGMIGGLYLPGGYPELYAAALAENIPLRRSIAAAVREELPTVAEGGGFLYLSASLQDSSGASYPMAGVLPGQGFPAGKLVRFGYTSLEAEADSLLFRRGESVPAQEFHHWDSTHPGEDLRAVKPLTGRSWPCAYGSPTLYAGFPQLSFAGRPVLAERFVEAAASYRNGNKYGT